MTGKELVFKIKADFLKSIANPVRLAVLERLKAGEASVGRLVTDLGVEQSSLSKHLSVLRQAGVLSARQERSTVYYSVRNRDIYKILRPISEMLRKKLSESRDVLAHLGRD